MKTYVSNKIVFYEGDNSTIHRAAQISKTGPLIWNVMNDDFLELDLPGYTFRKALAGDAVILSTANTDVLN